MLSFKNKHNAVLSSTSCERAYAFQKLNCSQGHSEVLVEREEVGETLLCLILAGNHHTVLFECANSYHI